MSPKNGFVELKLTSQIFIIKPTQNYFKKLV